MKASFRALFASAILVVLPLQEPAPPGTAQPSEESWESALTALYAVISGPAGQARDWEAFRAMFAEQANMMISIPEADGSSRLLVLTPDEYVERSGAMLVESGFSEREIGSRADRFGNLVQVFSAYEGVMQTPAGERTIRGVNSVQLLRTGEGWKILNIAWEQETPQNKVPASLVAKPAAEGTEGAR